MGISIIAKTNETSLFQRLLKSKFFNNIGILFKLQISSLVFISSCIYYVVGTSLFPNSSLVTFCYVPYPHIATLQL